MRILSRDSLAIGGFAGIVEHRLVTDSRIFGERKEPEAFEGLGNMVYLADAQYKPFGSSGMHPHTETDVISIIVDGRVNHKGSMEHGKDLVAGDVQVQRAGGEGFSHDEINPDDGKNRMLQVWALPEEKGQRAAYKSYTPKLDGVTRIYGGEKSQDDTFDSRTIMDIVHLKTGSNLDLNADALIYVITGEAEICEAKNGKNTAVSSIVNGDLVRSTAAKVSAISDVHLLVVSQSQ
ncbi:MAG: pirin family protein [Halioglobus sp.]